MRPSDRVRRNQAALLAGLRNLTEMGFDARQAARALCITLDQNDALSMLLDLAEASHPTATRKVVASPYSPAILSATIAATNAGRRSEPPPPRQQRATLSPSPQLSCSPSHFITTASSSASGATPPRSAERGQTTVPCGHCAMGVQAAVCSPCGHRFCLECAHIMRQISSCARCNGTVHGHLPLLRGLNG